jgi:PemK-like, MazF-like toxin of type II toxin-antitoxin system
MTFGTQTKTSIASQMALLSMVKGKVVLIPFPFDDLSGAKVRPAVCLTEPFGSHKHILVAFITSSLISDLSETDILLTPGGSDFTMTGLKVPSTLRLHRMTTVTTGLIRRELGIISTQTPRSN